MPTRREFVAASSLIMFPLLLAGCVTTSDTVPGATALLQPNPADVERYGAAKGEKFSVPAVDVSVVEPQYLRRLVDYRTTESPGTVVVDTPNRYVYLVLEHGKALRYGVGVGREGLEFKGVAKIALKREWPHWTPTPDMIKREPKRYGPWKGGMAGGAQNPLGARALYLFKNGKDTFFRIHGTTEPESIGKAVSSGCIRMINQDVIDFYNRVPTNSKVVVLQGA